VLRNKIDRAMGDAVKYFFSCYFLLSFHFPALYTTYK
jgi:hypothetical protein